MIKNEVRFLEKGLNKKENQEKLYFSDAAKCNTYTKISYCDKIKIVNNGQFYGNKHKPYLLHKHADLHSILVRTEK